MNYHLQPMSKMCLLLKLFFILLSVVMIHQFPVVTSTQWCVATFTATNAQLQANIDSVCNQGRYDCSPIKPGGICFNPNTLPNHASFVMNLYYQKNGRTKEACNFGNTGTFTVTDPSYGGCVYGS